MDKKTRATRIRHHLKRVANETRVVGEHRNRLAVHRTGSHIYAQIIDDMKGETLVSSSTVDKKLRKDIKKTATMDAAEQVGKELAERAKKAGVEFVYFDRGGLRYHGRIKALADAARAGGLKF